MVLSILFSSKYWEHIFQQDNDPDWTKIVKELMHQQPPQSSDRNPIENWWQILDMNYQTESY